MLSVEIETVKKYIDDELRPGANIGFVQLGAARRLTQAFLMNCPAEMGGNTQDFRARYHECEKAASNIADLEIQAVLFLAEAVKKGAFSLEDLKTIDFTERVQLAVKTIVEPLLTSGDRKLITLRDLMVRVQTPTAIPADVAQVLREFDYAWTVVVDSIDRERRHPGTLFPNA